MAPAHDHRGLRLPEDERLSSIGRFLRRSRLDEMPQLWNVLIGDMALIGPRPLLAVDQPAEGYDRLVVRPGLTGWAQVKGGRTISPDEKAALDLWWIRSASVALDLQILAGTVRMVVAGESVNGRALAEALTAFEGRPASGSSHPPRNPRHEPDAAMGVTRQGPLRARSGGGEAGPAREGVEMPTASPRSPDLG